MSGGGTYGALPGLDVGGVSGCPQGVRRVSEEHHYSGLSETIANQMGVADQNLRNPVFIDETPNLQGFSRVGTTGIEPVTSTVSGQRSPAELSARLPE